VARLEQQFEAFLVSSAKPPPDVPSLNEPLLGNSRATNKTERNKKKKKKKEDNIVTLVENKKSVCLWGLGGFNDPKSESRGAYYSVF